MSAGIGNNNPEDQGVFFFFGCPILVCLFLFVFVFFVCLCFFLLLLLKYLGSKRRAFLFAFFFPSLHLHFCSVLLLPQLSDVPLERLGCHIEGTREKTHDGVRSSDDGEGAGEEVVPLLLALLRYQHLHWRKVVAELRLRHRLLVDVRVPVLVGHLVRLCEAPRLEDRRYHLDVVVRRLVEHVHVEVLAVERCDVLLVLVGDLFDDALLLRRPKGEVVDGVRHVGEGRVQHLLVCGHALKVQRAGHTGNLDEAPQAAALLEDGVVHGARAQVPLACLVHQEAAETLHGAWTRVRDPLTLLRDGALVRAHGRVRPNALLLTGLLELNAVDLQHADVVDGAAVGVLHIRTLRRRLAVDDILELVPGGLECPARRTPVGVKEQHRDVVRFDHAIKAVVLEVVRRRRPVGVVLGLLDRRQLLLLRVQLDQLVVAVHAALVFALVVDLLPHHVLRHVQPVRAERVPHADVHVVTGQVLEGDVEVDLQELVLVAVHEDCRARCDREEGVQLTREEDGTQDGRGSCEQRTVHGAAFAEVPRDGAEGVRTLQKAHRACDDAGWGGGGKGGAEEEEE
eukprot:Rhum_TRINITY_DN10312_c0_g2::Rhum_TRINITY_DN10312_c0_g2_i1::g.37952::m.37952